MSRILVIGGYGGFGARLSRRLADAGHDVLVGGRDPRKATRLAGELGRARAVQVDRTGDVVGMLSAHRPDLVIDAAGPFQASDYRVPEACIATGTPYLDLADARDFVGGIGALDAQARAAGVVIISGASSVPALTSVIARELARGLHRVVTVDVALSAANRASGGASVVAAILSYVGQPVRLWRGGRWTRAHGWGELRREDFILSDGSSLRGRLVAITDLPDHDLLPTQLAGRPAVTFRAGTELGFQMIGLWLLSFAVRWGWLRSLRPVQRWLLPLYRLTERLGGARSAMSITLKGEDAEGLTERRWTIVAENGDGLEIPTLAAALLADDVAGDRLAPGAYPAAGLLGFARFEGAWADLAVSHETCERRLPPPLYARVLGAAFHELPDSVRLLHSVCGDAGAAGEGEVHLGGGWAARLIAAIMRFPPPGLWPLHVHFAERDGTEIWTRDFGGPGFSSELSGAGGRIIERFGPLSFVFSLPADERGLEMQLKGWSALGIPLPPALAPRIRAREWDEAGRFRFDVRVAMPLFGDVIRYSGWLEPCGRKRDDANEVAPPLKVASLAA